MRARLALLLLALASAACSGRSALDDGLADAGADVVVPEPDAGPSLPEVSDKVDLLLVLDNSRNLSHAQELFARTLPYLFDRIANPACVNGLGNVVAKTASPSDPCPIGQREFRRLQDVHVGVITTSLGGHGADICSPRHPSFHPDQDLAAHLSSKGPNAFPVSTYQGKEFLWWDPGGSQQPPGLDDVDTLTSHASDLVRGLGTQGCGFESQLESIYRFLIDPEPYLEIQVDAAGAVPTGIDPVLLQQREDFLRRDSAVVVLLLTDENDCSTRDSGQYYLSNQAYAESGAPYHLPRARSVCAKSPTDPCCASCGQETPQGCPPTDADPSCLLPPQTDIEDPINLRCFDQKRRFGVDFLFPIERYISGLSKPTIVTRSGATAPNPLLADRSSKLVVFAGILGVPWQDLASDPKALATGFKPASQIDWSWIVGDGEQAPVDPLMNESIAPRRGSNPAIGADLAPTDATSALANPINGHERVIALQDDLQYACIYPLPAPKACDLGAPECECSSDFQGNPICQQPDGSYGPVQRFGRALPSIRPLRVMQALGDQAVVASICAQVSDDEASASFGFKPAIDGILRALRTRLIE